MAKYCYTNGDSASAALAARRDAKADRIRWMLELPDLTRRAGSPVRHLLERVLEAPSEDAQSADADLVGPSGVARSGR